jgi:CHASE3 domain sensor protein
MTRKQRQARKQRYAAIKAVLAVTACAIACVVVTLFWAHSNNLI